MNISAVDMSGIPNSASVKGVAPGATAEPVRSAPKTSENGEANPAQLKRMVENMQSHLDSMNVSLEYSMYGNNDSKIAIKVVNKGTGEVIREIPTKEIQALQSKMSEMIGMIFNGNG